MTTPKVGVTHDVVIYEITGNIQPIGLIIEGLQISEAPTFAPRLSIGSPAGLDYAQDSSWVQDRWDTESDTYSPEGYYQLEGLIPSADHDYRLRAVAVPSWAYLRQCLEFDADILWNEYWWLTTTRAPLWRHPGIVKGVKSWPEDYDWWNCPMPVNNIRMIATDDRIALGNIIMRPYTGGTDGCRVLLDVVNTLPRVLCEVTTVNASASAISGTATWAQVVTHAFTSDLSVAAYDAVTWSTMAFISTYRNSTSIKTIAGQIPTVYSAGKNSIVTWQPLVAHYSVDAHSLYIPVGTTTGGALAIYDNKLWRADTSRKTRIAYYTPEQSTLGFWSDWIDVSATERVIAMCEFIGRLMIGCQDGLYAYESGRTYKVVDLSWGASLFNFAIMKAVASAMYFNVGPTIYRYTSGGLLERLDMPTADEGWSYPTSIEGGQDCVYITTMDRMTGHVELWRLDTSLGSSALIVNVDKKRRSIWSAFQGCCYPSTVSLYRVSPNRDMVQESFTPLLVGPRIGPGFLVYPEAIDNLSGGGFAASKWGVLGTGAGNRVWEGLAYLTTGFLDYGYPQINKQWRRVKVSLAKYSGVAVAPTINWRTRTYETWRGVTDYTYENDKYVFTLPNTLVSPQVQCRVNLQFYTWNMPTATTKDYVEVESIEVEGLIVGPTTPRRKRYNFYAEVVDNLELLDGTVENSAAHVAVSLSSLIGAGRSQVVAVPWPTVGHTTEAVIDYGGPGISVPVMSYSLGAGIAPGAHISLVVTEV